MHITDHSIGILKAILDHSPIGMLLVNKSGCIIFSNLKSERIFGYRNKELLGLSIDRLVPNKLHKPHESMREEFSNSSTSHAMDYGRVLPARKKDNSEIQVQIGLNPFKYKSEKYTLVSIIDMRNQVLKIASYHDALTGLPNRNLFKELSNNLLHLASRNQLCIAVLFIDLDGFKYINDTFSHSTGDKILCKVSEIFSRSIRKNDVVSRIGGDEFVIFLYGIKNKKALKKLANTMLQQIISLNYIDNHKINISASIGAHFSTQPGKKLIDDLLKDADKLMYDAKNTGKAKVIINND